MKTPLLPALALFAAAAAATAPAAVYAQEARPPPPAGHGDVESVDAIIDAVYDVISGDAGVRRDWDRFGSLFAPGATLSPTVAGPGGVYGRNIITPAQYAENAGAWLEGNGFHEIEINRVTERYGVIAHAFSTYESRRAASDPEPFARGINSFQLMNDGSRWWVVSIFWQEESEEHPIPAKYLPGG